MRKLQRWFALVAVVAIETALNSAWNFASAQSHSSASPAFFDSERTPANAPTWCVALDYRGPPNRRVTASRRSAAKMADIFTRRRRRR
uniref:Putative secreted protein n=1 Tax=Rhipicephalus microplus TaxID=6941 RepID=A0A6M2DAD4_RHIMP